MAEPRGTEGLSGSRRTAPATVRARESTVRSEAEDRRRGWGGVRLCSAVGWDAKGQLRGEGEARRRKHRSEGAVATERGAQQAARALVTGALEIFAVGPLSVIYKRAAAISPTVTTPTTPPVKHGFPVLLQSSSSDTFCSDCGQYRGTEIADSD